MNRRTAFVGRSRSNDIRLTDRTVSRRHAELTLLDDGRVYVTDCGSKYGTFVRSPKGWQRIRQEFVHAGDAIRLGDLQIRVGELLAQLSQSDDGVAASVCNDGRSAGPVIRNPLTGEVVRKT